MANYIKTLKEGSDVILPRTKVSAVSDDNNVGLEALLEGKQATLVSGTNIKTVDGQSIVGSGNLSTQPTWGRMTGTLSNQTDLQAALDAKQPVIGASTTLTVGTVNASTLTYASGTTTVNVKTAIDSKQDTIGASTTLSVGTVNASTLTYASGTTTVDVKTAIDSKQATLVSGTNIKSVNNNTLLGSGNLDVGTITAKDGLPSSATPLNADTLGGHPASYFGTATDVANKQDTLVSGSNIKTINGQSVLGSGNLAMNMLFFTFGIDLATGQLKQEAPEDIANILFRIYNGNLEVIV